MNRHSPFAGQVFAHASFETDSGPVQAQRDQALARSALWSGVSSTLVKASLGTAPLAIAAMALAPVSQGALPILGSVLSATSLILGATAIAANAKASTLHERGQDLGDQLDAARVREQMIDTIAEPLFGSQTFGKRLSAQRATPVSSSSNPVPTPHKF